VPVRYFTGPLRHACLALPLVMACAAAPTPALAVPPHDRVVVVVMENKSYDEVRTQPYTAGLMLQGATFTSAFGVTHPSQPNYIAMWAGSLLGVTNDNCPASIAPSMSENLGHACEVAGLRWRAYSENLGSAGSAACSFDGNTSTGLYTRKHDPWTQFSNLNHANERPYPDLAADLAANTLPNLVFIIPNNCHNTHNSSTAGCGIADGDAWLAANLPAVIAALGPKGLLVLTWDEDDASAGNRILTVFVGPQVITGAVSAQTLNHFTLNRMICEALGLPLFANGRFEATVANVWKTVTPTQGSSWGHVKAIYR
jgi:phosphatidylinositol-3-phosphatase